MDSEQEHDRSESSGVARSGLEEDTTLPRSSDLQSDSTQGADSHPNSFMDPDLADPYTIPCHHIRLGDYIILQDRPCQVIKIATNSVTGRYRYTGVDVLTKTIYEEDSVISFPEPGVVKNFMLGPIFKQYIVLGIENDHVRVTIVDDDTEWVLPILTQSNLQSRLAKALESASGSVGGSVRAIVLRHNGIELVVDMKVVRIDRAETYADETLHAAVRQPNSPELDIALQRVHNGEIDINARDDSGETVLDIAVSNASLYSTAFKLLDRGALPTAHLHNDVSKFLSAAAEGNLASIEQLLNGGFDPQSCDRLGYTGLHEASCFGHYELVELLIRRMGNVNVNMKITHGGATVLHAIIGRGLEHRQYLDRIRGKRPRLTEDHVRIVTLLLQKGANTELRRSRDNLTAQECVSQELRLRRDYQPIELCHLQRILILLNKASEGMEVGGVQLLQPSTLDCHLELRIEFGNSNRDSHSFPAPIRDFIYGNRAHWTPRVREGDKLVDSSGAKDHWRWIHLPANNKDWVEDLARPLSSMEGAAVEEYRKRFRSFTTTSYDEASNAKNPDQVVVKYFKRQILPNDQANTGAVNNPRPTKLLMVKQMWIWRIDDATLITAFPDRGHSDKPELLSEISGALESDRPVTLDLMISRMLKCLVRFVDAPTNAGLDENLFHIFEQSIAHWAQEYLNRYEKFCTCQDHLNRSGTLNAEDLANRTDSENKICDIKGEVNDLKEIKDVIDELKMIQRVLEDQKTAIYQYSQRRLEHTVNKHHAIRGEMFQLEDEKDEMKPTLDAITSQISKAQSLSKDASSVEESLKNLLDLKQKQGSLIAVRDTRSLANQADDRAKDSARQNQLLFIFTVVTVVFTPISFTSTFMAVPTQQFPHDGEEVSWEWWQLFLAGFVAEFITFLPIIWWLVSKWNDDDIRHWLPWLRNGRQGGGDTEAQRNRTL
ncbi:hypothetical protein FSARC_7966 [Fusarium sarcochroum]|uniref:Ankyrin repeat protein n=1 Tax=Fusarium sarcochroum TaxID=1208366 RepID=A0A8H4TU01_9HYPO|nr:hypothetical protein FSARC_7966 [Fusarium sarcochroum]